MKAADTTPVSEHARAEDWRVLTVLGPYRLLLVAILLTLFRSGYGPDFLLLLQPLTFFYGCLAYAISALVLLLLGVYRRACVRRRTCTCSWIPPRSACWSMAPAVLPADSASCCCRRWWAAVW